MLAHSLVNEHDKGLNLWGSSHDLYWENKIGKRKRSIAVFVLLSSPCNACQLAGACFSKVPKLFGRISGDIILSVSSKRRRLEARNFAVILIFIPFITYEKIRFTEKAGRSFTNGFSGPKSSRDFRETGPRELLNLQNPRQHSISFSPEMCGATLIWR